VTAAEAAPTAWRRAVGWARGHAPTRANLERNRFLRPVAHRVLEPALWRFTRRSVPRGVALGTVTGILFPFAHMPLAAVLALPARANVPTAVAVTLINNPLTVPFIWWAAYDIGRWVLRLDREVPDQPIATNVHAHAGWLHWLVAQGGPALLVGLVILAIAAAALGYAGTAFGWRWWIARKWRRRHGR
jgi:uncharacterized protein (DUF2062 family)